MNTKLIDSIIQIINSLDQEERTLLEQKIRDLLYEVKEIQVDNFSTQQSRLEAVKQWAESHKNDSPLLSDQAVSRKGIYEEY